MIVKQSVFQARCVNNHYDDFGSHTGFKITNCEFKHLVVGEWHEFRKNEYWFDLYINGNHNIGTGHSFNLDSKHEIYSFYHFFSTIEEIRDFKLDLILTN